MTDIITQLKQTKLLRESGVAIAMVIDKQIYHVHFFVHESDSKMMRLTLEINTQKDLITGYSYDCSWRNSLTELIEQYAMKVYNQKSVPEKDIISLFHSRSCGDSVSMSNALILSYCMGILESNPLGNHHRRIANTIVQFLGRNIGKWVNEERAITYNLVSR